jgi:hypothetical protein
MYYNPSRTARLYDAVNNRMIEPGEKTALRPDNRLLQNGQMLETSGSPTVVEKAEPIIVSAAIELEDKPKRRRTKEQ